MWKFKSNSVNDTFFLGELLGKVVSPGTVILLKGDLGAGKTHFTKGVAKGLVIDNNITSPTFTLINQYQGRLPLYHMDFYRLEAPEEADDLGVDEYLYSQGVTIIEWPQRIGHYLPEEYLEIIIESVGETNREFIFNATGAKYESLSEELKNCVHPGN